jgi:hypothetical protein
MNIQKEMTMLYVVTIALKFHSECTTAKYLKLGIITYIINQHFINENLKSDWRHFNQNRCVHLYF